MKILFISSANMIAAILAYVMKREGHKVKLFIDEPDRQEDFTGMVEKTDDWRKELKWVGKGPESLIVFDDIGYGKIQDELRAEGYSVFGGCAAGDRLESDRQHAQEIFAAHGIKPVPIKDFNNIAEAIKFVKTHKGAWVIKQNGHASKSLNYVSQFDDSRDVLNLLENYSQNVKYQMRRITLQQKVEGVEIAVSRFFNGSAWIGPACLNVEHKKLFPGDLGPPTSEMGTLAWYENREELRLFEETLGKLEPYLKSIDYRGIVDFNCIVNETGAYPLEATPRFGSPIIYAMTDLHVTPWGQSLKDMSERKTPIIKVKHGYGLVVLITVTPFPYAKKLKQLSPRGLNIYFNEHLKEKDFEHIHYEGVAMKMVDGQPQYYISDDQGYVLYVTAVGHTVQSAQKKAYGLAKNIVIPKMFYRNDICNRFLDESYDKLHRWGYL